MFSIGLSYIAFIMLRYVSSIPSFFKAFYHERMLNFVKGFFCVYWDDQVTFVLYFVYVLYYVYLFAYVEASLHPWNETNLIIVYELLNMLLNLVCVYFAENFYM
jgi:hypothetical protein